MSVANRNCAAGPHHPSERLDHRMRNDPALVVSPFRPGVGIENEDAGKEGVRRRFDETLRVAATQPDVDELLALNSRKRGDDAVEKRLAADEADVGVLLRPFDQVLAGAEADLEPDLARTRRGTARGPRAPLARSRPAARRLLAGVPAPGAAPCRGCARKACAAAFRTHCRRPQPWVVSRRPCVRRGGAACRRGPSFPTRSRRPLPAGDRNGRRPRCGRRSDGSDAGARGCRAAKDS